MSVMLGVDQAMMGAVSSRIRVAYSLEQLWHRVPGGTGMAALRVSEALVRRGDVDLIGVAGRHSNVPGPPWTPSIPVCQVPLGPPFLYDAWLRLRWPLVERSTGDVDVVHSTSLIPVATKRPHVVTLHDLAWRHDPTQFTKRGVNVFERSLAVITERADRVLCSSSATLDDARTAGIDADRLRLVPLGVEVLEVPTAAVDDVRSRMGLGAEYLLFVGTVEPRKNLGRLLEAVGRLADAPPVVVVGAAGWGDRPSVADADVRFLGFVSEDDKHALYAGATAFCYPSEREGFGMPVLEAMAHGTPVVTSRGTSTEEAAGGCAVLVDPFDVDDIARGVTEVLAHGSDLIERGLAHARARTWDATATLTHDVYRELL